jgi:hypothetical protein
MKLMAEFREYVAAQFTHTSVASPEKGLRKSLKPFLRALASRFDDLEGMDRIVAAQVKLDRVQTVMVQAIHRASENDALLEPVREATLLSRHAPQTWHVQKVRLHPLLDRVHCVAHAGSGGWRRGGH